MVAFLGGFLDGRFVVLLGLNGLAVVLGGVEVLESTRMRAGVLEEEGVIGGRGLGGLDGLVRLGALGVLGTLGGVVGLEGLK